jgi:ABC-2 type transport system permease protein
VPLAALWLGTSVVGDLVDDRLLVYLWLKPVPQWQLPAAAVVATASVVIPLTALPLAVSALVAGAIGVAGATLLAAVLGALAYCGLFVAAGLWFRRAIWWGLAFVLIWENVVGYAAAGSSRFTVVGWVSSVLGLASGIDVQLDAGSAAAGLVILPAVAVAAWLVATWRYRCAEID